MKRILLFFIIIIALLIIWLGESRRFFCLSDGKCVTVWKTYNDICYIIPGKYYGIVRPASINYIKTSNLSDADIIWLPDSKVIIANINDSAIIVNNSPTSMKIVNYNFNKDHNDTLFTYFDGKYHRYKKNNEYISVFIKENYALDKNGKSL